MIQTSTTSVMVLYMHLFVPASLVYQYGGPNTFSGKNVGCLDRCVCSINNCWLLNLFFCSSARTGRTFSEFGPFTSYYLRKLAFTSSSYRFEVLNFLYAYTFIFLEHCTICVYTVHCTVCSKVCV